jgi:hypothetical protein
MWGGLRFCDLLRHRPTLIEVRRRISLRLLSTLINLKSLDAKSR